jgi:hypothetical protein
VRCAEQYAKEAEKESIECAAGFIVTTRTEDEPMEKKHDTRRR